MDTIVESKLKLIERIHESIVKIEEFQYATHMFLNDICEDSEDELNRVWDTLDSVQSFIDDSQNAPEFEDDWALPVLCDITFSHFRMLCNIRLHGDEVTFDEWSPFVSLIDSLTTHLYRVLKSLLNSSSDAIELFLKGEFEE